MAKEINESVAILRRRQVEVRTGLSRSSIYAFMSAGNFPKPVHLGPRAVGWLEIEISQWLGAQIEQSRRGTT